MGVSERLTLHKNNNIEFLCNSGWFVFVNTLKRLPCYGITITVLQHNRFLKSSGFLKVKNKIPAHFFFFFLENRSGPKENSQNKEAVQDFCPSKTVA